MAILFLLLAVFTEFYYIEVSGGYLRPYHFLAPVVILTFINVVDGLLQAPVFWLLIAVLVVNLAAAAVSDARADALNSLLLLYANASVALAVSTALMARRLTVKAIHLVFTVALIASSIWGVAQVLAYSLGGLNLSLSPSQFGQISAGFAPAFRTEANGFAKFLSTAFLFTFPAVISLKRPGFSGGSYL